MRFFGVESERKGTCYHEFQKGKWDEKTVWKADSLLLDDDVLEELKLYELFQVANSNYNYYGVTQIAKDEWKLIRNVANMRGGNIKEAIDEVDIWVTETFKTEEEFTILGI